MPVYELKNPPFVRRTFAGRKNSAVCLPNRALSDELAVDYRGKAIVRGWNGIFAAHGWASAFESQGHLTRHSCHWLPKRIPGWFGG